MKRKYILFIIAFVLFSVTGYTQVINAGIGGNSTNDLLHRIETDVLSKQPDLVIVMVGTNDLLNSRKMISYKEYTENYNTIVRKLHSAGIEMLLMSSPPVDSTYLFSRHDRKLYTQAPNVIMDSVSHIVSNIAKENKAHFLNLNKKFSVLGLPKHDQDLFFRNPQNSGAKDGVHPTSLGYHFIAANVFQYLKENDLLATKKKIICFGDSITNGSGSKGQGTITGQNYPSFLSRMINDYQK